MKALIEAVSVVLDDVLYPASAYRDYACRVGAGMIRRYCGLNVAEALKDYWVLGEEELAVRAALAEQMPQVDERWITKVSAAMAACSPRLAPYADAMEIMPIMHAMGCRMGLIGDGPPLAQRLVAKALHAQSIFSYRVWLRELPDSDPWGAALHLMGMRLDCPLNRMAVVCADPCHADSLATRINHCYCVFRQEGKNAANSNPSTANRFYTPMANLYELPEALGWVAF